MILYKKKFNANRRKSNGEYVTIYRPDHNFARTDGFVLEHRLIWELYNNACLLESAEVHHKDGNGKNNNINNLIAMTGKQHRTIHHKLDKSERKCIICNGKTYINKSGIECWFLHPITGEKWICSICNADIKSVIDYDKSHARNSSICNDMYPEITRSRFGNKFI